MFVLTQAFQNQTFLSCNHDTVKRDIFSWYRQNLKAAHA